VEQIAEARALRGDGLAAGRIAALRRSAWQAIAAVIAVSGPASRRAIPGWGPVHGRAKSLRHIVESPRWLERAAELESEEDG
jgi:hypothetical protein